MLYQELPREMEIFLKEGNIEEAKKLFSLCEPNAVVSYRSNIFSLSPLTKEFALWAKERGADINFVDHRGQTPIYYIIRMDGDVSLLIELGADIEAARPDGFTPLHAAAARGRKKAMRTLLKAGAKIDAKTRDYNGYGHFTPLETVLYTCDLGCTKKYDLCKFLLDRGAEMTDRSRQFVSAFSEVFHRHTAGKKPSKFLQNQEAAVENLCKLFDAEMRPAASFHDGVSPILLTTVGGFTENFTELWNFLVPPRGRAQTAQGEVIRIAGRIEDELMRNGGLNWDKDYRNMLYTFREYIRLTEAPEMRDTSVDQIVDALGNGDVNDGMIYRLCYTVRHWVEDNPEVMPLLEADYDR